MFPVVVGGGWVSVMSGALKRVAQIDRMRSRLRRKAADEFRENRMASSLLVPFQVANRRRRERIVGVERKHKARASETWGRHGRSESFKCLSVDGSLCHDWIGSKVSIEHSAFYSPSGTALPGSTVVDMALKEAPRPRYARVVWPTSLITHFPTLHRKLRSHQSLK